MENANESMTGKPICRRGAWIAWKGEPFYTANAQDYTDLAMHERPAFLAQPKREEPSNG